ncbi:hypothetical protein OIU34_24205 [Pararhizobium sp. BT-229]|uniref:hypothetical protein n=1 Tax=Pararhizobium sp. BT-229 TaxID=2986923 RepID=UPI0021F6B1DE|nr:hypothetical protein [Pararhizobium sp. BT-229]MCV9965003.1 hypothetical protein [Pararhizobium sp. BT-229]
MIDEREYSIDFRNEPARSYFVDGRYVRPSTDYKQSELGERMFRDLRGLITAERSLIGETDDVDSRKIYNLVARSLSYIARRIVVKWESAAVAYEAPDSRELLEIERKYYLTLMSEFDEDAVAAIGKVGDMSVTDFYRNVVKATEGEVNLQTRLSSRYATILGGFSRKYLPAIRERLDDIEAELEPAKPAVPTSPAP